jgi:Ca2+-binding RTX toxin-like protein
MGRRLVLPWLALAVVGCALFASPAVASAAQRYATPTPDGMADCSQEHPCSLQTAVESAANGDEVIVNEGTYNEGTDQLHPTVADISIHGAAGQQRPVISFGAMGNSAGVLINNVGTANLRRLTIDYGGSNNGLLIFNASGVAEQLLVRTAAAGACEIDSTYTLRDSVCSTSGSAGAGLLVINYSPITTTLTLRNVTAVGTGSPGWGIFVSTDDDVDSTVEAKSVIAVGGSGGGSADVWASNESSASATATVNLAYSNYDSECEQPTSGSVTCVGAPGISISNPGSPTNQTAAPVFADSDFHQAASSPTIDSGISDASTGTADFDGDQRSLGSAVDIGADEFVPSPPPPDGDGDGIPDASDACPGEPGPAANNGCPSPPPPPDSDGGGVPDAAPPTCKGKRATIIGTPGNDVRTGTAGPDVMVGQGGNDKLSGLAGNDLICGGAGKDKLKGGPGQDTLLGQAGKDILNGGGGNDTCKGGKGNDSAAACELEKSI